ncbi:MAG: SseB family protein [Lachnospiraceae bacterium]|nr:SseB family protein [Lachnospiraceae bacterium]
MNGERTTDTASEKLWKEMDRLVSDSRSGGHGYGDQGSFFDEREMLFMNLLKDAYDNDLGLIVSCTYDTQASTPGRLMAKQGFLEVDGMRFLVCFTSEKRAREAKYNTDWNIMKARDVMNNMFNKKAIWGLVFNPNDERMVIVLKDLLSLIMPGEKPKPEMFKE